jgi:hypothetical protein
MNKPRKERKPRVNTIKLVRKERHGPAIDQEEVDWRLPTPHWLELDKARLAHWWAKLNGEDTVKTLAAWAKLLHVPRTRKPA